MIDICFITMFVWSVNAKLPSIACLAEQSSTIWWRKGAINITGTGCTHFCSGSLEDKQWTVFLERCTFGKAARKNIFKFYRWNNTRFVVWESTLGLGEKSWSLWASEPLSLAHFWTRCTPMKTTIQRMCTQRGRVLFSVWGVGYILLKLPLWYMNWSIHRWCIKNLF